MTPFDTISVCFSPTHFGSLCPNSISLIDRSFKVNGQEKRIQRASTSRGNFLHILPELFKWDAVRNMKGACDTSDIMRGQSVLESLFAFFF